MTVHLPEDFDRNMRSLLGDEIDSFRRSLAAPSPVSIRVNPAKSKLITSEMVPWSQYGCYLPERPVFTLDPRLHAGAYYVQEASSMFLEHAVSQILRDGQSIKALDLCAAPGGKSTHLLSLLPEGSMLVSNETIRSRASVLSENLEKWGSDNMIVTSRDPSDFNRLPSFFDLVVVDAPCSGEGLFRKDPDAVRQWSEKNVALCSQRQQRILSDIWDALKPGGHLIYSTCTYNPRENLENLLWLQQQFKATFIPLSLKKEWQVRVLEKGSCMGYQFFPHLVKGEGFFLAVIQKVDGKDSRPAKPKGSVKEPSASQMAELRRWLKNPESKYFFLHHDTVRILPANLRLDFLTVLSTLSVHLAGTGVAEITKNKFVPEHSLALSKYLNREAFNRISVTREQALEYLRKNSLNLDVSKTGFSLVEFEGLGTGWVNVLPNRINNLYPADWRIRMGSQNTFGKPLA